MYRNVMVPVDGSSFSREAVLHGLRIALQCGATLRLVRVATSPALPASAEAMAVGADQIRSLHSRELSALYALAAECRAHSTVSTTASLENGPVVDALVAYAHRHDVDLIVMRTHARRGLARVWFGSIADGLIRESGIPVLVVRPPSVSTSLEGGVHVRRILVPLDGSDLAEKAIEAAVSLARMEGASITLLRVVTARKRLEQDVPESSIGPAPASEVSEAQRYLDSLLTWPEVGSLRVTGRVVISSDVAATIRHVSSEIEADLITLATRGRGAIKRATAGSVSDEVMRESVVSVLVVHPELAATAGNPAERARAMLSIY